jgi:hypothetical protein
MVAARLTLRDCGPAACRPKTAVRHAALPCGGTRSPAKAAAALKNGLKGGRPAARQSPSSRRAPGGQSTHVTVGAPALGARSTKRTAVRSQDQTAERSGPRRKRFQGGSSPQEEVAAPWPVAPLVSRGDAEPRRGTECLADSSVPFASPRGTESAVLHEILAPNPTTRSHRVVRVAPGTTARAWVRRYLPTQ